MTENLKDLGINFPEFWNTEKVLEVLKTYDSFDLPEYFLVTPAAFIKLMKQVMPNKPSNQSYSKYLKEVLDPKPQKPKYSAEAIRARQQESEYNN